ncbi:MAG TPA: hypothetical protein VH187_07925 [Scandinavium sp.]|jgi:hypothetical protein|uniref:hypothetical protein n=1 Tax=Scandinavium sp. TaxID=2830653 RepID=UPI002E33AC70|nr:hypothetical protein [Scandinavium sp.]HEX4501072.1 hypothetical protein [Scandinavium sp.]
MAFTNEDRKTLERIETIAGATFVAVKENQRLLKELVLFNEAKSATVNFGGENMDITVHITDTPQTASAHEWTGLNGTGIEVKPIGTISWASSNPAVTVDPASGLLDYVAAGTAAISFADSGNTITGTGNVTVVAGLAQSGTVTFA